jgi:ferric-dicitrate binding protein FerR (iron transport regulator)
MTTETAAPPDIDEYEIDLLPLRRRKRLPLLTALLALAVVGAAAFVGGVEIQKHYGTATTAAGTGAGAGRFAGRFGAGGAGATGAPGGLAGPGGAGASGTAGIVTAIKGTTLYVTDFTGNVIKVKAGSAQVRKTVNTSVKSLHPGDTITLQGPKQKDGSYKATTISLGTGGTAAVLGGNG